MLSPEDRDLFTRQAVALERIADLLEAIVMGVSDAGLDAERDHGGRPSGPPAEGASGSYATVEGGTQEEVDEEIPQEERIDPLTDHEDEGWDQVKPPRCNHLMIVTDGVEIRCTQPYGHFGDHISDVTRVIE